MKVAAFLLQPEAHPIGLHALVLRLFGIASLNWEPETIWEELEYLYGTQPSSLNKSKIQACRTVHITDSVFDDWKIFSNIATVMNFSIPQFSIVERVKPSALAHASWAIQTLRSGLYGSDVLAYIVASLLDSGFVCAPKELDFVDPLLKKHVPEDMHSLVKKTLEVPQISLPTDRSMALQVLRLRSVDDYVTTCKRMYHASIETATLGTRPLAVQASG